MKKINFCVLITLFLFLAIPALATETIYVHKIKWGETLAELSSIFNIPVREIMLWNPGITDPDFIIAGNILKIPLREKGIGSAKFVVNIIELPASILALSPEFAREVIEESLSKFADKIPGEMLLSGKSLSDIKKAIDRSAEKIIGSLPGEMEIAIESREQIIGAINSAVKKETGATPYWAWPVMLSLALILAGMAFILYPFFRDWKKKKSIKEEKPKEKTVRKEDERPIRRDADRKEFENWLESAKKENLARLACFRCGVRVGTGKIKKHLFENCPDKPEWAKNERSRELALKNEDVYVIKP